LKRALLIFAAVLANASELENLLNNNYNELFNLELQKSLKEKDYNSLSWVAPVQISYTRSFDNTIPNSSNARGTLNISINQPIFKSGGIYYGIKSAQSGYNLSKLNIIKQKNELIATAIELLFKIKQTKLNIAKLNLQIKNAQIEIKQKSELLNAGLENSISLDNAYVKKDEATILMLQSKSALKELIAAFKKISDKDPNSLKVPKLKLIDEDKFLKENLDIKVANANAINSKNLAKLSASKYLPTISAGVNYSKFNRADLRGKSSVTNYNLTISMPLSINTSNDLQIAKLNALIAKVKAKTAFRDAKINYNLIKSKIKIINEKIALSKKEANIYFRLYKSTKNLYLAGQRSKSDVELFKNSYKIKKLDVKIYRIEKEIELLKLYKKIANEI
jgi:outer membrane protein TolC